MSCGRGLTIKKIQSRGNQWGFEISMTLIMDFARNGFKSECCTLTIIGLWFGTEYFELCCCSFFFVKIHC